MNEPTMPSRIVATHRHRVVAGDDGTGDEAGDQADNQQIEDESDHEHSLFVRQCPLHRRCWASDYRLQRPVNIAVKERDERSNIVVPLERLRLVRCGGGADTIDGGDEPF